MYKFITAAILLGLLFLTVYTFWPSSHDAAIMPTGANMLESNSTQPNTLSAVQPKSKANLPAQNLNLTNNTEQFRHQLNHQQRMQLEEHNAQKRINPKIKPPKHLIHSTTTPHPNQFSRNIPPPPPGISLPKNATKKPPAHNDNDNHGEH